MRCYLYGLLEGISRGVPMNFRALGLEGLVLKPTPSALSWSPCFVEEFQVPGLRLGAWDLDLAFMALDLG